MLNNKIFKMSLMLLGLIVVFHLLSKTNTNFQKPENIENLECDSRLPHVKDNFWGGKKKTN
jgi:hypothetical protein